MAHFEQMVVVDAYDLTKFGLDYDAYDALQEHYEASNDTYHRYYPGDNWKYIKDDVKQQVNQALITMGVPFPDVLERPVGHPNGYYQFHVLLCFS